MALKEPRGLAGWCLLAGVLSAQEPPHREPPPPPVEVPYEEVVARHDQGKPFWETKWIVRDDGTLTQWPNPAAGGSTWNGLSFVGDEFASPGHDPLAQMLGNRLADGQDGLAWLAPMLRCPGDLLAATFAERHFAQLGRDASDVALRQFLVQPDTATTAPLQRRERLDRELAIRLLQQRGVRNAVGELQTLAKGTGDAFVRRAAQETLASLGQMPPPRVELLQLAIAPPVAMDLWLWLDAGQVSAHGAVAAGMRQTRAEQTWEYIAKVRPVRDLFLAGAQFQLDVCDEVPYEAARLWGRARVDQCLLGFRDGEAGRQLAWAAASGVFEVPVLVGYLQAHQVPCTEHEGLVHSEAWWPGFSVDVAPDHIVVQRQAGQPAATGAWPTFLAEARQAGAALAAEMSGRFGQPSLPWLLLEPGELAMVRLAPFALQVSTKVDAAAVLERCAAAAERLRSAALEAKGVDVLPRAVVAAWQAALRGADIVAIDGTAHVRFEVGGKDLDPVLLHRLWQ